MSPPAPPPYNHHPAHSQEHSCPHAFITPSTTNSRNSPLSCPGADPDDPLKGAQITLYTCGPTVYDFAHIGNFRAFLFADILRRYLEFKGATVHQVMNMTDVGHMVDDSNADAQGDDKMKIAGENIKKVAKKTGKALVENPDDPYQVAQFFVDQFLADARALQVEIVLDRDAASDDNKSRLMPRPTQFIPPFIAMIQTLINNHHAYIGSDGVVYYSVASFPNYGRLSGNSVEQLSHGKGGRTEKSAAKRHPADFFLWKPDPHHIMKWPSPWGEGYPGWHIECSAMATTLLGPSIDLHTGGEDNIFPHHECEIAQSEAATGKPFAQFWMHTRHLMVDGEKMSKSKGNFYTIQDLVAKGYDPLVIRFSLINARYRETLNFTLQGLHEAASALTTLRDLAEKLQPAGNSPQDSPLNAQDSAMLADFTRSMDDDLNIAGALGTLFTWAAPLSKQKKITPDQAPSALAALKKIDTLLAVIFPPLRPLDLQITAQIDSVLAQRYAARTAKDWPKSDQLRQQLTTLGIEIKDTPTGTTWRAPASPPAEVPRPL